MLYFIHNYLRLLNVIQLSFSDWMLPCITSVFGEYNVLRNQTEHFATWTCGSVVAKVPRPLECCHSHWKITSLCLFQHILRIYRDCMLLTCRDSSKKWLEMFMRCIAILHYTLKTWFELCLFVLLYNHSTNSLLLFMKLLMAISCQEWII